LNGVRRRHLAVTTGCPSQYRACIEVPTSRPHCPALQGGHICGIARRTLFSWQRRCSSASSAWRRSTSGLALAHRLRRARRRHGAHGPHHRAALHEGPGHAARSHCARIAPTPSGAGSSISAVSPVRFQGTAADCRYTPDANHGRVAFGNERAVAPPGVRPRQARHPGQLAGGRHVQPGNNKQSHAEHNPNGRSNPDRSPTNVRHSLEGRYAMRRRPEHHRERIVHNRCWHENASR
jgi:hypothetical protein